MRKLLEFEPRWIERQGERIGIAFLCPCCRNAVLTAYWNTPPFIAGDSEDAQLGLVTKLMQNWGPAYVGFINRNGYDIVPCKRGYNWTLTGDNFETMTLTPSIDASAASHWHGSVINGEIV